MRNKPAGRQAQPASADLIWVAIGGVLVALLVITGLYWVSALLTGVTGTVGSKNPIVLLIAQLTGTARFSGAQIAVMLGGLVLLAGMIGLIALAGWKARKGRTRVDDRARSLARVQDFAEMTAKGAAQDAQRLGATSASQGVPIGKLVNNMTMLFASWEWVQVWICGPRAGKSSCVVVPQIMETTGPVLTTSNKRDVVDMTRGPRSRLGRVWVHDPQNIIGEDSSWYWNPLSFVTDLEKAEKLTDVFVAATTSSQAREDAYFGPTAKAVLARYFYAAALGERPITDVYRWVGDETDFTAVRLLRDAGEHGAADSLEQNQMVTSRQRDGIFGQVRTWVGILGNPKLAPWVRADARDRPEFDPHAFVRSRDTIYLVSREGGGSARAITAALVMAILTTAEETAARQPGGRLSTPLMAVLDEAANVVRWPDLPDLYSHYGSRGIVVSTFFQSYSQGMEAFGEHGMNKLWSASNIRVAGSGLSEDKFLSFLSSVIGDRDVIKRTSSVQGAGGNRQVSTSVQRERTFDAADIAQLPRGRGILTASGMPAALISFCHYSEKPYAADIEASVRYYEGLAAQGDT